MAFQRGAEWEVSSIRNKTKVRATRSYVGSSIQIDGVLHLHEMHPEKIDREVSGLIDCLEAAREWVKEIAEEAPNE